MLPTPEQTALLQPLFAAAAAPRGRPPCDDLAILPAVLWKLSHNLPWEAIPSPYPSPRTCYRRYQEWQRLGLLQRILSVLYTDLAGRGGFDLLQAYHQGIYTIHRRGPIWTVVIDPAAPATWQLATARIFIWLVLKRLRRDSAPSPWRRGTKPEPAAELAAPSLPDIRCRCAPGLDIAPPVSSSKVAPHAGGVG